jgi:hypothetical protein
VQEHFAAVIACNKAEAFFVVKELNFAGWHTPPLSFDRR